MLSFSNDGDSKGTVILPIEEYHKLHRQRKEANQEVDKAEERAESLHHTAKQLNKGAEEVSKLLSMLYRNLDGIEHWINQFNEASTHSEIRIDKEQETIKIKLLEPEKDSQ